MCNNPHNLIRHHHPFVSYSQTSANRHLPLADTSRKRTLGHVPSYIKTTCLTSHKQTPGILWYLFCFPSSGVCRHKNDCQITCCSNSCKNFPCPKKRAHYHVWMNFPLSFMSLLAFACLKHLPSTVQTLLLLNTQSVALYTLELVGSVLCTDKCLDTILILELFSIIFKLYSTHYPVNTTFSRCGRSAKPYFSCVVCHVLACYSILFGVHV